jgi:twitching motility protein PilT
VKLLDSLLDAIVRLEGDALVMHVGEKPYVITASASMNAYRGPLAWGQVELSSRVLTFDAVSTMLAQILPVDQQRALDEFGAIEHEILPPDGILDRFTVVAARGGEDVWVEVRRKPVPAPAADLTAAEPEPHPAPITQAEPMPVSAVPEAAGTPAPEPASEQPIAEPPPHVADPDETIVVALPGEGAEAVSLDEVPENAIQVVDEEPQGVPTEDEVDAMMAATASALLTSGLSVDHIPEEPEIEEVAEIELEIEAHDEQPIDLSAIALNAIESPAFELSPPSEIATQEPEPEPEDAPVQEAPAETPLFSAAVPDVEEQAATEHVAVEQEAVEHIAVEQVAVAPTVVEEVAVEQIAVEHEVPVEQVGAADSPVEDPEPVQAAAEQIQPEVAQHAAAVEQPAVEEATLPSPESAIPVEAVPDEPLVAAEAAPVSPEPLEQAPPPVVEEAVQETVAPEETPPSVVSDSLADEDAVVGAIEITSGQEESRPVLDERAAEPIAVNTLNAGIEPAASEATPLASDTAAEMQMDATPESRHVEPPGSVSFQDTAGEDRSPFAARSDGRVDDTADAADGREGVVVPLARAPIKPEIVTVPYMPSADAALMQTLRAAAARGAATVYVVAQSKPMIRVDGEIIPFESEPTLTAADVDRLVLELAPPRRRDALQNGPVEWLCDVPEIGRVRCLTFKDHRGPGVLFRMFPPRAISADQLGLTPEVQALCQQSDGLVLVTGARASGKSTLLNAFVDLINRTRSDHVITVETQIGFVHESRRSFISQRETRGDADFAASVARAALREDPDVMMIEDLKSADLVSAALEAAESGRLVLASVPAASTIAALERLIEVFPPDRRAKARTTLATALRGVIAQVLLRRVTGGRVAAREILLNTPAVSTLLLEGKMFQLPVALDSGRRHGMIPLTDSLATQVREGTVHVGEAYRKALDRAALVAVLKREGIDTSFAERMA